MQSGDNSLWVSFPHVLESLEGARRYISAFRAPFQELSALSPAQIHTLRACSLLAIPPPPERVPQQGGFPTDLSELNLSGWAALVQDVVAGLQALPANLGCDMGLPAVALLQVLEASTGVGFCCYCCSPGSQCKCRGASQPVPPVSWSQFVEQTPGYGVITSSGGMTTPSTQGLPAASQGLSHVRRSIQVRAVVERQARAQLAQGPRGLALHTPQMAPPLHQPPPGQLSTPYKQVVQPPSQSSRRGVTFNSPVDKTSPTLGQSSEDCGRQRTREWGGKG